MSDPESPLNEQAQAILGLIVRPRSERAARIARLARPKLIARANEFLETCDGACASFNSFAEAHQRFILAISKKSEPSRAFGISFVTCLYLAGPTSWNNIRLRCTSLEDADGHLLYEISDVAAGFVVRSDSIVIPAYDLTFAYE